MLITSIFLFSHNVFNRLLSKGHKKSDCMVKRPLLWRFMIDWMVFTAVFNSISVISRQPVYSSMLSWSFLTSTPHNIPSKPWLLSRITIGERLDCSKRGINPVTMTIINLKEYWPSRGSHQRPPVLKLPTELWGLAELHKNIVGNRENASNQKFLFLPLSF